MNFFYDLGVKAATEVQQDYTPEELQAMVDDATAPNYALRKTPKFLFDTARNLSTWVKAAPIEEAGKSVNWAGRMLGKAAPYLNRAVPHVNRFGTGLDALALLTPGDHYNSSLNNPVSENAMHRPAQAVSKLAPIIADKFPALAPAARLADKVVKPFNQPGGYVNAYRYLAHDVPAIRAALTKLPVLGKYISPVSKAPEALRGASAFGLGKLPTAGLAGYGSYVLGDLAFTASDVARGKRDLYGDSLRQSQQGFLQNALENLYEPGSALLRTATDDGRLNAQASRNNAMGGSLLGPLVNSIPEHFKSQRLDRELEAVQQSLSQKRLAATNDQLKAVLPDLQERGKNILSAISSTGGALKKLVPSWL